MAARWMRELANKPINPETKQQKLERLNRALKSYEDNAKAGYPIQTKESTDKEIARIKREIASEEERRK